MRRLSRLIALSIVLALLAAACGSDSDGGTSAEAQASEVDVSLISRAVDQVADASTGRFAMTVGYEGLPGLDGVTLAGEGEYDIENAAARVSLDMGALFDRFGDDAGVPPGFEGSIETITIGTTVYMGGALFSALPGIDAEWVRLDAADLADEAGLGDLGLDSLTQNQSVDPRAQLEQLRALGSIEEVGTEDVRGVATTHYAGEVRLGDAFDQLDETQRDAAAGLYGGDLDAVADVTMPIEVWVDEDDLVRRVSQRVDFAEIAPLLADEGPDSSGEFAGAALMTTIEYFDIGDEIIIAAPDGAVDLFDALGGSAFGVENAIPGATEN